MKKIILLCLVLLAVASCKKQEAEVAPATAGPDSINLAKTIDKFWESVTTLSAEQQNSLNSYAFISRSCGEQFNVTVDLSTLSQTDRTAWVAQYDDFSDPHPTEPNKHLFNVQLFIEKKEDYTREYLSKWLKDNGELIDFGQTRDYINCAHEVQTGFATYFAQTKVEAYKTYDEIMKEAEKKMPSFKPDNYKFYIKFDFDGDNNLTIDPRQQYVPDGGYFSIPLLKEVIRRHGEGKETTRFDFRRIVIHKDIRTFFSVTDKSGKTFFYDFSQIPSGITGPSLLEDAFSPF